MQVVILCGGKGTRLKEETEFRPKPMVNIGNRPILWHIMRTYASYGHTDFILPLGYKSEMIKSYFWHYEIMNNDVTIKLGEPEKLQVHTSHDEKWKVTLANTGENTLKGARIKKIEKYITDDIFLLTYGDGVADINLNALLEFHKKHGKMATITGVNPTSRFGEMRVQDDRVIVFSEKPKNAKSFVNGGYFVLNRKIFQFLEDNEQCDFEIGALERVAHKGELMVYKHPGFWTGMDTLRDVDYLNQLWNDNKAPWKTW